MCRNTTALTTRSERVIQGVVREGMTSRRGNTEDRDEMSLLRARDRRQSHRMLPLRHTHSGPAGASAEGPPPADLARRACDSGDHRAERLAHPADAAGFTRTMGRVDRAGGPAVGCRA